MEVQLVVGRCETEASASRVSEDGWNLLHLASSSRGTRDCRRVQWVLDNTELAVNSTSANGWTALSCCLASDSLDSALFLVERGGNLFARDGSGKRAIERGTIGKQVLQHAKDVRWEAVRPALLLLPNGRAAEPHPRSKKTHRRRAPRLAVFENPDISHLIATFLQRTEVIVRDPAVPRPPKGDDAVKRRVEAKLLEEEGRWRRERK